MEPSLSRILLTFLAFFFFGQTQADNFYDREEIKERLESMECIVKPRYTTSVEGYIKGYLTRNKGAAERVMGRAVIFFPIFEKYLEEHGLPQDLKYLAIVESALLPKALSPVGAGGLWQFMKETGRIYGLHIDGTVDERSCANSSTEAAMEYLAKLYEKFESWELALAAYNCGAGNILKASRRARSNDYWKLSRYLPRETQNFVPAFLGAAYIVNYYHLHEVAPLYPHLDLQLTDATKVYNRLDFNTIAAVTQLPVPVVAELNPAFKKSFIPEDTSGHYLYLPKRVMPALKDYIALLDPDKPSGTEIPELPSLKDTSEYRPDELYFKTLYTVAEGDKIEDLAKLFSCSAYHLKAWNELISNHLIPGQELTVWFPKEIVHFQKENRKVEVVLPSKKEEKVEVVRSVPNIKKLPQPKIQPLKKTKSGASPAKKIVAKKPVEPKVVYYHLQRNESLVEVAKKFPGVTVQDLIEWNGFSNQNLPRAGMSIKVITPF